MLHHPAPPPDRGGSAAAAQACVRMGLAAAGAGMFAALYARLRVADREAGMDEYEVETMYMLFAGSVLCLAGMPLAR